MSKTFNIIDFIDLFFKMASKSGAILSGQKLGYAKYLSKKTMKPFFRLSLFYALFNDSFVWPMILIIKYEKRYPKSFFSFANI